MRSEIELRISDRQTETNPETGQATCDAGLFLSVSDVDLGVAATLRKKASRPIWNRDYEVVRCCAGTAQVARPERQETGC